MSTTIDLTPSVVPASIAPSATASAATQVATLADTSQASGPAHSTAAEAFQHLLNAAQKPAPPAKTDTKPADNSEAEGTQLAALAGLLMAQVNPNILQQLAAPLTAASGQPGEASTTAAQALTPGAPLTQALQSTMDAVLAALPGQVAATNPAASGTPDPTTPDRGAKPNVAGLNLTTLAASLVPAAGDHTTATDKVQPLPANGSAPQTPSSPAAQGAPKLNPADAGSHLPVLHMAEPAPNVALNENLRTPESLKVANKASALTMATTDPVTTGPAQGLAGTNTLEPARLTEAQGAQASATASAEIIRQMSAAIGTAVKTGQGSVRVQLYPDDLGHIDLRLTTGAGGVHVMLTADKAATASLLGQHLGELQTALTASGVTLAGLSVSTGGIGGGASGAAGGWGAGNGNSQNTTPGWQAHGPPAEVKPPQPDETRPAATVEAGSRVDYWI